MNKIKILKLLQNQHGWSVGCIRFTVEGEVDSGFTMITFPTEAQQIKYFEEAKQFFGLTENDFTI